MQQGQWNPVSALCEYDVITRPLRRSLRGVKSIRTLVPAATVTITGKRECGTYNEALEAKTSAVLAELRESFTEMDEEDWDLHRKRQFTRQRHEDKRKFLVSLRPWMDDKLPVSIPSEEDDNRPDYCYTGCAPVTHDKEVASPEDNHRSVCGSLGCAPITMDSKHSSDDNGDQSHCVFLGCAPLSTYEQAVPPTMAAGFYGESVYPSAEVMHGGVIYFQTVSTRCLRFVKFLAWKRRFETWLNGFSICVCVIRRDLVRTVTRGLHHANFELCPAVPTYKLPGNKRLPDVYVSVTSIIISIIIKDSNISVDTDASLPYNHK
ncbi:hypothetical protein CLF_101101, partial [Clonorchis sinensis]